MKHIVDTSFRMAKLAKYIFVVYRPNRDPLPTPSQMETSHLPVKGIRFTNISSALMAFDRESSSTVNTYSD